MLESGFAQLPSGAQELAAKAAAERDRRRRAGVGQRERKAAALAEKAGRSLHRLLGKRRYPELRELMRRERLTVRDLLQPPKGLGASYEKLNGARKRKAVAFLRDAGVDLAQLTRIRDDYHRGIADALSATDERTTPGFHLESSLDTWRKLSPFHAAPLPWGVLDPDGDTGGWQVFRPPFFGFLFGFVPVRNSNFTVDRIHALDPPTALVGISVTMDDGDAGDFDYASGDGFSAIAFGFVPPATGLVEVLVDAQSVEGSHRLQTRDEWGWSNSSTGQTNYLLLDVLHPNVAEPSYAEMSRFSASTSEDHDYHRENLVRGQHYFAHLFSAGPVPAGQSVVVVVGTREFDISGTNDVEIHSKSDFRWFVNSVEVRISP
jgi:hypothetical protein